MPHVHMSDYQSCLITIITRQLPKLNEKNLENSVTLKNDFFHLLMVVGMSHVFQTNDNDF